MSEFFKSFAEWLEKRSTTSIISTFGIFWIIVHWQVMYVTLFVSEQRVFEKFGLLKNEYVNKYFLQINGWDDLSYYVNFALPFILTFLFIWVLPNLLFLRAFAEERDFKVKKRLRVIDDTIEIEQHKLNLAKQSTETRKEDKKAVLAEKDIEKLDPQKANEEAFDAFSQSSFFRGTMQAVTAAIYEHFGNISSYEDSNGNWIQYSMDRAALARAHSNGIVNFDKARESIELTEKGRYFVSRFNS